MPYPYLMMTLLFASLAVLAALDSSLASLNLLPWFNGLRWLRVHLITLGTLTELFFGLLPVLVAARARQARPRMRWDIWLVLNAGLLTLLIAIPLVNHALIFVGGTLVFIAALLLMKQLGELRGPRSEAKAANGRIFYLTGLAYLLLGIIIGTGLWLGWGEALRMSRPIEVHIHANNWGFMSLVFAGLLIDLYPSFAGRPLAWPRSIRPIYWMLTMAALLLVLGPWIPSQLFTVPGIILFLIATGWLLANVIKPLIGVPGAWGPGLWHLILSYVWIVAPVLVAPLILLEVTGFPGAGIELNAPQALIYGWVLQFGYAFLPYLFARLLLADQVARLGGTWFTVTTVNLGGVFLWASIFFAGQAAVLHGIAYGLWAVSLIPIVASLWRIARAGYSQMEDKGIAPAREQPSLAD
ncbi:MAG: hypothetical protein KDI07_07105 [Anaerolineae bacterium]|nr:hypothetical protein [Anaerolineae bacterium]MCB0240565.1 hypothetical protein [Anaerolineae bacterium]MCB0243078.1 hypothetical protein [Anaerolineae bacterium]MCB0248332.1 hypothetical protein [Anaerolineae bacterium]MCB9133122.1 hypothetical protein [Anaerolineales bacterium]